MSPQLCVTNIERSIEFYTNKLGFNIHFRYKYFYTGIIKDGFSVHLNAGGPLERERKKMNEEQIFCFRLRILKAYIKCCQMNLYRLINRCETCLMEKNFILKTLMEILLLFWKKYNA